MKNKREYVERAMAQVAAKRTRNRDAIIEYLEGHPCVDCGETHIVVLEFDHRDPWSKSGCVGALALTRAWPSILAEIEKCDVRCWNCHRRRTAEQFGWARARLSS